MVYNISGQAGDRPLRRQTLPLEKQFYSIKEFGAVYGLGTTSIYGLFKAGALKAVKIGGLTKIRRDDAEAWAERLPPRISSH
jgi:excisionase family DNA binding protein